MAESTANALAHYFSEKRIPRSAIGAEHLATIYQGLKRSADSAFERPESEIVCLPSTRSSSEKVWGVIVETRPHPLLATVVSQFVNRLNIKVQIFHGTENEKYIKTSPVQELIDSRRVHMSNLGVSAITRRQYNALFLDMNFWKAMQGRTKILVFQTDALLCEASTWRLSDFAQFDYIGSKWNQNRPVGIAIDGGNGGLSLRDWALSQECLLRFPAGSWPGGEDGYFAFHLDLMGANVARANDCARFSTQSDFLYKSFGAHQIQNLDQASLQRFLRYCPEAQSLLV